MAVKLHVYENPDDQAAWDGRVAAAPGGHVLQSWGWGELKARFGWHAQRVALGPACAQVLYRSLPGGLGTIAYAPKGPVGLEPAVGALLEAIQPLARQRRALCLKIEPELEDDPAHARRLHALGFRPSPQQVQPRRTISTPSRRSC
jgi:lipid II:glycine glycyltransferase (peptidoglycan interpeptide bridge formation enzyme)